MKEVEDLEARLLAVPDDLSARYKDFLRIPGTGLTRLLPRGKYEFFPKGGGAYYSFSRRTHDYGFGSDIELGQSGFSVGFAGADYGFFAIIGNVPIEDMPTVEGAAPKGSHIRPDEWARMWTYRTPSDIAGLRADARSAQRNIQAQEGMTYLLRSISVPRSDTLVAFRVERTLSDGSVVIVWRVLASFQPPRH
jgi:hypothetical protein